MTASPHYLIVTPSETHPYHIPRTTMEASAIASYITTNENWGTMGFKLPTLTAPISSVNFIVHTNPDNKGEDGQPPTNHWTMYLAPVDESPVHVDVIPAEEGSPAMVIVENQELQSLDHVHLISVGVQDGTTVADIFRVIIQRGRDRYVFADIGEGCRYWMFMFVGDLATEGIASSAEAVTAAKEALPSYWPFPAGTPPVPREMAKGIFF